MTATPRKTPRKIEFVFFKRNSQLSRSVHYANGSKNVLTGQIYDERIQFQMEIGTISRRRSLSSDYADLKLAISRSCFTDRGRQRNVQRLKKKAHVHSFLFRSLNLFSVWKRSRCRRRGLVKLYKFDT